MVPILPATCNRMRNIVGSIYFVRLRLRFATVNVRLILYSIVIGLFKECESTFFLS